MTTVIAVASLLLLVAVPTWCQQQTSATSELEAIQQTALDYMDGALDANAERVARAVHPELHKVTFQKIPSATKTVLTQSGATRLVELVRARRIYLAETERHIEVQVLRVKDELACVKVTSTKYSDYLQLARIGDRWQIINVLWLPTEAAGAAQVADAERDRAAAAVKEAALDYIEGAFSADAMRMERAVHPELHKVSPVSMPDSKGTFLEKIGAGILIEWTRSKGGMLPEDKRDIRVEILDMTDSMACVEILSAMYFDYLELAKIDGEWKLVNVLWKMNPTAPVPRR
ncbi:MAG: nuclear transport factor 2 family protein [Planctomycetota bacterium]